MKEGRLQVAVLLAGGKLGAKLKKMKIDPYMNSFIDLAILGYSGHSKSRCSIEKDGKVVYL